MLVMSEPIFVGRAYEQQCYQALLKGDVRWLLIVTGQGGIGKSTLLRRFREITPAGTAVVSLNFADIALRTDALAILGELAEQVKQYSHEMRNEVSRAVEGISKERGNVSP